ncbi:MAG TPA: EutN/CcmL family microcompartment protein [Polyangia bacterium]|jgi:ethanolamine utilization protein EutN|nr:EutN/CcmL family microcompartment protein [Polyangia bacterium]
MVIGEVVGRLWASRQAGTLSGQKLLLVRPLTATGRGTRLIVAVDALDAGPGDRVIVARGSRVRDVTVGETVAAKDVVVGIVDGSEPAIGSRGAT